MDNSAHRDPKSRNKESGAGMKESIQEVWFMETDQGTQFYSNKNEGTSEFEKYLVSQSIKHIPSRSEQHEKIF